ncbi:MAG: hypothetical protein HC895_01910 [Leptolyngbyaceae cyanobacterium SM1_3_5]|nr:hypothetical protein [Leptolyngbyaceae cyanobacterium SM1_3_5]
MQLRQRMIEIFSTFAQFVNDRFGGWAIDSRLQRSMQQAIAQTKLEATHSGEAFWSLHWYRLYQSQQSDFAVGHLAAYLQETCYWAAHRMSANELEQLPDYFQLAIARCPKFCKAIALSREPASKPMRF